jgi:hypothetical protein
MNLLDPGYLLFWALGLVTTWLSARLIIRRLDNLSAVKQSSEVQARKSHDKDPCVSEYGVNECTYVLSVGIKRTRRRRRQFD